MQRTVLRAAADAERWAARSVDDILEAHAFSCTQGSACVRDPVEELVVVLEAVLEPRLLILEANQDAGGSAVARDQDLLASRKLEVVREIILHLRQAHLLPPASLTLRATLAPRLS